MDDKPLLNCQNLRIESQNETHIVIAYDLASTIDQSVTVLFDSDLVSI